MKQIRIVFVICLCALSIQTVFSQTADLSGIWQDEDDIRYSLRQVSDRVYWVANQLPRSEHVFYGVVRNNSIQGSWVDLPSGQRREAGEPYLEDRFGGPPHHYRPGWRIVWRVRTDTVGRWRRHRCQRKQERRRKLLVVEMV